MSSIDLSGSKLAKTFMASILFLSVVLVATECEAQRQRRWFNRGARFHQPAQTMQNAIQQPTLAQPAPNPAHSQQLQTQGNAPVLEQSVIPQQNGFTHRLQTPRYRFGNSYRANDPRAYDKRIYDPRSPFFDPTTPYPKYFGGFHASQIQNLGIPSGDIGLRGNSMLWTPW